MTLRGVLQRILAILVPLSVASTLYLYLYPIVHQCAFPLPVTKNDNSHGSSSTTTTKKSTFAANPVINTLFQHVISNNKNTDIHPEPAIFRLLVLADPQIEGDSALPHPDDEFGARLRRHWRRIQSVLSGEQKLPSGREGEAVSETDEILQSVTSVLAEVVRTAVYNDIPAALRAALKRLDLFGNDYYLAHIYRTLSWWTRPTHVTVLGDLIGSQWVTDEEFENRAWRYWHRLFRGGERVGDDITITGKKYSGHSSDDDGTVSDPRLEPLDRFNSSWARKIINVAGNHDIGYAGDVSRYRLDRFERVFGRANWDIRFQHPPLEIRQGDEKDTADETEVIQPTLHIINLNDLTLDGPALDSQIQADSYSYINDLITYRSNPVEDETSFTLLLTHVPLHKRDGICVDGPFFSFFDHDDTHSEQNNNSPRFKKDGLREQNHLSEHASGPAILQGIFGMSGDAHTAAAGGRGRRGLILTGHDHEGCDVVHFVNRSSLSTDSESDSSNPPQEQSWHWDATRFSPSKMAALSDDDDSSSSITPSIREVTLRSMMGMYGGHAALLSLWFDADPAVNRWQYELQTCALGSQHIWWAVHVLALVCLGGVLFVVVLWIGEGIRSVDTEKKGDTKAVGSPKSK